MEQQSNVVRIRTHLPKSRQRALMRDINDGELSRDEIMRKYSIATGTFYRYKSKAAEIKQPEPEYVGSISQAIDANPHIMTAPQLMDGVLSLQETSKTTRNYIYGMALVYEKTKEQIVEDLVAMALDIGMESIHAKTKV